MKAVVHDDWWWGVVRGLEDRISDGAWGAAQNMVWYRINGDLECVAGHALDDFLDERNWRL